MEEELERAGELRIMKHLALESWNTRKEDLHSTPDGKLQKVKEGEIWWVGVGENVGIEINGKSEHFSRPVLILKKFSRYGFMGVPLTSQPHEGAWYVPFEFQGKIEIAVLAQARVFSIARLYSRLGQAPDSDLEKVRDGLLKLLSK